MLLRIKSSDPGLDSGFGVLGICTISLVWGLVGLRVWGFRI